MYEKVRVTARFRRFNEPIPAISALFAGGNEAANLKRSRQNERFSLLFFFFFSFFVVFIKKGFKRNEEFFSPTNFFPPQ